MDKPYLSFSGFKKFLGCPHAYCLEYVTCTPAPPANRVGMLYGTVVGLLVESFYRDKLWRQPDPKQALLDLAPKHLQETIAKERAKGAVFKWKEDKNYKSPEDLLQDILDSVPRVIGILKEHRLLGSDAQPEVKLDSDLNTYRIGGRADVKLTRIAPHNDHIIYDGKGSLYREQYTDVRQLYWYAMLNELKYGVLPEKVAFVYWRSQPKEAVDWYPVTREAIEDLKKQIQGAMSDIQVLSKRKLPMAFPHKAGAGKCRVCDYSTICDAGRLMASKSKPDFEGVEDGEDVALGVVPEAQLQALLTK